MKAKLGLMSAMLLGSAAFAADGIKLGGFVDGGYSWQNYGNPGQALGTSNPIYPNLNTFSIPDAGIFIGKTMGMGEVMISIPFSTNSAAGKLGATNDLSNNLLAGFNKAQAWVSWKYDNGFMWKVGQFNKLYGFESNDTVDVFFARQGLLYSLFPQVHTGLQIGYDFSDALSLSLLIANPAGMGIMPGGNPDLGFKLSTKMDAFWASVGGLFQRPTTGTGAAFGTGNVGANENYSFDIQAGTKVDTWNFDIEAVINHMNTLNGFGILGEATYGATDMIDFGVRGEWNKAADANGTKTFEIAVGPAAHMSKDFTMKLNYQFSKVNGVDGSNNAVYLDAVHRF